MLKLQQVKGSSALLRLPLVLINPNKHPQTREGILRVCIEYIHVKLRIKLVTSIKSDRNILI